MKHIDIYFPIFHIYGFYNKNIKYINITYNK